MTTTMTDRTTETILGYHERTKHQPDRYARSLGYMDWANQPDPFRAYAGAPQLVLPLMTQDPPVGHRGLFEPGRTAAPLCLATIAGILELSMGLSAWKEATGSRWALRMNPSSGNLHPTEAHLILPAVEGCPAGIYHYSPLHHCLERRADIPGALDERVRAHLGAESCLVGLTSIFWRESWKYGERAFRYCNHDVGHALAALRFAANLFGWGLTWLSELSDQDVEIVLGLNQTRFPPLDEEHPDLLACLHPLTAGERPRSLPDELLAAFGALSFRGNPNALSREHVDWEIIGQAAEKSRKPATRSPALRLARRAWLPAGESGLSAAQIIRRRRSATAFDPRGFLARRHFLAMLDRTLPRDDTAPFDLGLGSPALHLLLFVHRVDDLDAGLYVFCRDDRDLPEVRAGTRPDFLWEPVEPGFPLYRLALGDFRQTAAMVSCNQDIAGDSAFSLGMIARFGDSVRREPFRYRHLFWESGLIGQVLYLEAEARGARGTGIGCFFDDAVHDLLGIDSDRFQSLYHFTVGRPLEDSRITTRPPYFHRPGR
jgi:SagB-type dehydrogenase family enzyme